MTGVINESPPTHYDEKHAVQPLESNEIETRHSHQEVADASSNEAGLHESEKDIPVSVPLIRRCISTDHRQMTFRRFMSFTAMAFLWTGSQIPVYLFGMVHSSTASALRGNC
jgi:hypothetical protein